MPALERLAGADWQVTRPELTAGDQLPRLCELHRPLTDRVARSVQDGTRPVSVAGDCCSAIAVLAGLQRAGLRPVVVWLDAHGDFNTHETTISGFVAGMALAMLTGRGDRTLIDAARLTPLADVDVVLADARDLDPAERALLDASQVTRVKDLDDLLAHTGDRPIYVHFDTDILDPIEAPAVLYPAPGGPSVSKLLQVAHRLQRTGRIVGVSMTTWSLERDTGGGTGDACMSVLRALVGED